MECGFTVMNSEILCAGYTSAFLYLGAIVSGSKIVIYTYRHSLETQFYYATYQQN
jgi:hypothetical protein